MGHTWEAKGGRAKDGDQWDGGSGVPNASAQCVINVQLATSSVTSAASDRWVARGTAMLSLVEAVVALSWLLDGV